jgi:hypothetical protein
MVLRSIKTRISPLLAVSVPVPVPVPALLVRQPIILIEEQGSVSSRVEEQLPPPAYQAVKRPAAAAAEHATPQQETRVLLLNDMAGQRLTRLIRGPSLDMGRERRTVPVPVAGPAWGVGLGLGWVRRIQDRRVIGTSGVVLVRPVWVPPVWVLPLRRNTGSVTEQLWEVGPVPVSVSARRAKIIKDVSCGALFIFCFSLPLPGAFLFSCLLRAVFPFSFSFCLPPTLDRHRYHSLPSTL